MGTFIAEVGLGQPEKLDKNAARRGIAEALDKIWILSNSMPAVADQTKSKADFSAAGYYDYKIIGSVFSTVRQFLDTIIDRRLVTDETSLNTLIAECNELAILLKETSEIRENMERQGKSGGEIREYLNRYGKNQNEILDRIIKKIIEAFNREHNENIFELTPKYN
jgi:hypothetical protein